MSYDTIKGRWQRKRLESDCRYWQEHRSTGKPEPGVTIIHFNEYGDWRYDGMQEGYGSIGDSWQFTSLEYGYTVNLPRDLTGVPLVQALQNKAKEKLG